MSTVSFTINGTVYSIPFLNADTSLNSYIRNYANLRGTKAMCHEGGCGACIVSVTAQHPVTKKQETFAVNSCLVSVFSCHQWDITTIEGIGNKLTGYHPIQQRLASFNGTQCGYCSPGFVMNMYSLQEASPELTMKEIENSFASNICRCTGYRPIADAFKSFAKDADPNIKSRIRDIEDLSSITLCKKSRTICTRSCSESSEEDGLCKIHEDEVFKMSNSYELENEPIELKADNIKWFKVYNVKNILAIFKKEGTASYRLVAGNTAQGVYNFEERVKNPPAVMIDITSVAELRKYNMETNLELGANMTLAEIMNLFTKISAENVYFQYLNDMYKHMDLIANIPVRNIGTLAGNLSIKHRNTEFPSDMFLILETVGAYVKIVDESGQEKMISLQEYLKTDMLGKLILNVSLPPLTDEYKFKSYKIMRRAQNTHAMVNAGFLMKFKDDKVEDARIVFGGVNPEFIHATNTENEIKGKNIFTDAVLKQAIQSLNEELKTHPAPAEPGPEYRKKLAIGLFYKYILTICPNNQKNPRYESGGEIFDRPVSSGKQEYQTRKDVWPLNQPIPKLEAFSQTSGEAKYCNDLPTFPNELYAAFVLANEFGGELDIIDGEEALKIKGVVALLKASDIPGKNTFTPGPSPFLMVEEEILCNGKIKFHGQPVAIIVAETERLANTAALKVKVTYKNANEKKPFVNIRDVVNDKNESERIMNVVNVEATTKGNDVTKVIKGSLDMGSQYHFTMETQSTVCVPIEDGLDVYSATQWIDFTQIAIAVALKMPENRINVIVKRLGGGYGAKISRSLQIAAACALAAYKLNSPVRFVMSLEQNMKCVGKREACSCDYEVGVDDNGKIQYLINTYYEDSGCYNNECYVLIHESSKYFGACYDKSTWNISGNAVNTDTPCNTWCRAPGSTEGVAMSENIMEHIAMETSLDPLQVRLNNMDLKDNALPDMIKYFTEKTEYKERLKNIDDFNSKNRWTKRGISLVPMKYDLNYFGNYGVHVSVFQGDGSVAVCHGGIEMGQGINTKVAQTTAYVLGIPLEMVSIKASNSFVTPNALSSGGSQTSELCCLGAKRACERILEKLEPFKKELKNPSWQELVAKAAGSGVNLAENYFATKEESKDYTIWGVTITEVEIDVLTGNYQILRVDVLEDVGESLSPDVDVGQVEGALVMGIGYWTTEDIQYDKDTGALLTDRTWTYRPPGFKDIPIDFRVEFRKDSPNTIGILRSKATGEPPQTMAFSVVLALRRAIASARAENGLPNKWFPLDIPVSPESVVIATETDLEQFKLL